MGVCKGVPGAATLGQMVLSYPLDPDATKESFFWVPDDTNPLLFHHSSRVVGDAPRQIALSILSTDGLCIASLQVNGGSALTKGNALPRWLDNPCDAELEYQGLPCSTTYTWNFVVTTTSTHTSTATSTTETSTLTRTITTSTTKTTSTRTMTETTTSTTTATTTTTSTSSTATSSSTTSTSSTTTSTTTKLIALPPPTPAEAVAQAAVPQSFNDELYVRLLLDTNWTAFGSVEDMGKYEVAVANAAYNMLGLRPPAHVACVLERQGDKLGATLHFVIPKDSPLNAEQIRKQLDFKKNPAEKDRLNQHLSEINAKSSLHPEWPLLPTQSMFSCVDSVVYAVVHNAGVIRAYRFYFTLGLTLCFLVVGAGWLSGHNGVFRHFLREADLPERSRGLLVMPLFVVAVLFQSFVYAAKSVEKYYTLVTECDQQAQEAAQAAANGAVPIQWNANCPPPWLPVALEVSILAALAAALLPIFLFWWYQQWLADCVHAPRDMAVVYEVEQPKPRAREVAVGSRVQVTWRGEPMSGTLVEDLSRMRPYGQPRWVVQCDADPPGVLLHAYTMQRLSDKRPSLLCQFHLTPLESLMRRNPLFAALAVRPTDIVSRREHTLLVAYDLLVTFCVVMTAFFMLQRYEMPGNLTACFPYKLMFELTVAAVLKKSVRVVVQSNRFGAYKRKVACGGLVCIFLLDLWLWLMIAMTFEGIHDPNGKTLSARMRILDVSVGAGLVTFLLAPLSITCGTLLWSVYLYEPWFRHRAVRAVWLTSAEQVRELFDELGSSAPHTKGVGPSCGWEVTCDPAVVSRHLKKGVCEVPWDTLVQWASPSASETASNSSNDSLEGLVGLPSGENPVVVRLHWGASNKWVLWLLWLVDLAMSVDPLLPVTPRPLAYQGGCWCWPWRCWGEEQPDVDSE